MNPFATRMHANNWIVPVSVLSMVLGFMVMTASITDKTRASRLGLLGAAQAGRVASGTLDLQNEFLKISEEVKSLRAENDRLQKAIGDRTQATKVLNEGIQQAKAFAGLTDLQGPGVKVTLTDSHRTPIGTIQGNDSIIHDVDVLRVTNELFASGAEAIDVNGHRVVSTTSFRCVGPVIHVDGVPVASPVIIRAIGDPAAMEGGLNLPLGVLAEIRQTDPAMVQIEQVKDMRIAAYGGSTERKFAKVPHS
ncbi:MAG TPA: DUF881 domain-containing protein [Fimbriimonadaceae bacterium]|nr:DUF881 domain-containing protein [Fimbriimonadaceae bacterium]